MPAARLRRAVIGLVTPLLLVPTLGARAAAQTAAECMDPGGGPEDFGPTDITGVTGNQRLTAAVNGEGTVTALRWPSPSYYDQIKYRTSDRAEPHMGSLPNEGAFAGIAWRAATSDDWTFQWMRDVETSDDWNARQSYADDDGDQIVTRFTNGRVGLHLTLRDVVAHDRNVLVRRIDVQREPESQVRLVRVFSFANFNPVFSKARQAPYQDWCAEERNDSGAAYDEGEDAIVAERSGVDESTGRTSSVALAMGFLQKSTGHQIGQDSYQTGMAGTSAYDDAQDGELTGVSAGAGQVDGALSRDLDLTGSFGASTAVAIAAGTGEEAALRAVTAARSKGPSSIARGKSRWWARWLDGARLPDGGGPRIRSLAKRALVSIRQATDRRGLIVSSISTQPPFARDWIRDGAYINRALNEAGHPEMVKRHNLRYSELQATAGSTPPGGETTPPGNWAQNYYADGVVAGPVPYQVDQTGLGIFTLWDHYRRTRDVGYLLDVYGAIQRAAQYLTDICRDPTTGLQCAAPEGDGAGPSRTLRGAQAVWLGLDSAARAAEVKAVVDPSGRATARANARKWRERRNEIADGILDEFYDQGCKCFTSDPVVGGTFLWPARAVDLAGGAAKNQARENWRAIRPAIENRAEEGGLESQALLGNAFEWRGRTGKRRLKRGLAWVAGVPTTNDTNILGAAWLYPAGDPPPPPSAIVTMQGQPHVPSLAMFYLAALKTYGTERWRPR